jgi:hypothetical protein
MLKIMQKLCDFKSIFKTCGYVGIHEICVGTNYCKFQKFLSLKFWLKFGWKFCMKIWQNYDIEILSLLGVNL